MFPFCLFTISCPMQKKKPRKHPLEYKGVNNSSRLRKKTSVLIQIPLFLRFCFTLPSSLCCSLFVCCVFWQCGKLARGSSFSLVSPPCLPLVLWIYDPSVYRMRSQQEHSRAGKIETGSLSHTGKHCRARARTHTEYLSVCQMIMCWLTVSLWPHQCGDRNKFTASLPLVDFPRSLLQVRKENNTKKQQNRTVKQCTPIILLILLVFLSRCLPDVMGI